MPKVSVIVPVFKAERYIGRCAESLFGQTLEDMEFVFVDDCTPDDSLGVLQRVLDAYPARKAQVKIMHHERNAGSAAARITGLKNVTGDFVGWCDSDDFVESDMYASLYEKSMKEGLDMVFCDYFRTFGEENNVRHQHIEGSIISSMMMEHVSWSLCTRIAKRLLYDNVIYPVGDMGEDMVLTFQTTYLSKGRIGFLERPLYHYVTYESSICNVQGYDKIIERWRQSKANVDIVLRFIRDNVIFSDNSPEVINLKYHVRMHLMRLIDNRDVYELWKNTYPEINRRIIFTKKISWRRKVNFITVYLKIYKFLNRSM